MTQTPNQTEIAAVVKTLSMGDVKLATIKAACPQATDDEIGAFLTTVGIDLNASMQDNYASAISKVIDAHEPINLYMYQIVDGLPCHAVQATIRHHLLRMRIDVTLNRKQATKDAICAIMNDRAGCSKKHIIKRLNEDYNRPLRVPALNRYLAEIDKDRQSASDIE